MRILFSVHDRGKGIYEASVLEKKEREVLRNLTHYFEISWVIDADLPFSIHL